MPKATATKPNPLANSPHVSPDPKNKNNNAVIHSIWTYLILSGRFTVVRKYLRASIK